MTKDTNGFGFNCISHVIFEQDFQKYNGFIPDVDKHCVKCDEYWSGIVAKNLFTNKHTNAKDHNYLLGEGELYLFICKLSRYL